MKVIEDVRFFLSTLFGDVVLLIFHPLSEILEQSVGADHVKQGRLSGARRPSEI